MVKRSKTIKVRVECEDDPSGYKIVRRRRRRPGPKRKPGPKPKPKKRGPKPKPKPKERKPRKKGRPHWNSLPKIYYSPEQLAELKKNRVTFYDRGRWGSYTMNYTHELGAEICKLMEQGYSLQACCGMLELNYQTVKEWKVDNKHIRDTLNIGAAKRVAFLEKKLIESQNSSHVTSAMFALKNSRSEEWAADSMHKIELSGAEGAPLVQQVTFAIVDKASNTIDGELAHEAIEDDSDDE